MSEPSPESSDPDEDPFDLLAAECIEALEQDGPDAFEALLSAHPADAEKIRRRVASLSRLGLLELPKSDWAESIGPYRVVRRLGSGGMGEVVLGEHAESGAQVAIKLGPIPQASLSSDHEKHTRRAAERFAREVRAVADLKHPSIVPITEVGQHRGRAWFAMEYVEGVGLDQVLEAVRSGAVPPADLTGRDLAAAVPGASPDAFGPTWVGAVAGIVRQIASALIEAHAAGIVHRDIKPSNILLSPKGRVQIVDFGLAHLDDMPTLTLSGEFAGTPYYVAPEQIENVRGGIDGRADVFSLGVTLYECASLQRPFTGRTPIEVLTSISSREPRLLRRIAPHLPADLERLCGKALEKNPALRYANMAAFAEDLGRLLEFRPLLAKPPSAPARAARWARRRPWRAASAVLAGLLVLGVPVGLLVANGKIRAQRDRVQDEARRNGLVVEHFVHHFDRSTDSAAADEVARALLDRGVERLSHEFDDEPGVRASLLHASGRAYLELGRPADARPLLDRALGIWLREGAVQSGDRARVLADLARAHLAENRPGIARDLAARALGELRSLPSTLGFEQELFTTVASAHLELGDIAQARETLGKVQVTTAPESLRADVAGVWEAIGHRLLAGDDLPGARDAFESSLSLLARAWAPDGARLAVVHDGLADTLERLGDQDEGNVAKAQEQRARAARLRSLDLEAPEQGNGQPLPFLGEPAWAQAYTKAFNQGVAAIQAGRLADARERFQEAHAVQPAMPVPAYNLACVESREGRIGEAAKWLDRARRSGFACTEPRSRSLKFDGELSALRDSPEGRALLDLMESQWEETREFTSRNAVVPAPAAQGPAPALLVVVHDHGELASEVATGPWLDLARALGATLLVPSAPFLVGATPAEGTAWSPDPRDLWKRPQTFGQPILDAVRDALQGGDVDPGRVWIAGRGVGAMLALDLLVENPGLFHRGWLEDPLLHGKSGAQSGSLARALGARLAVSIAGSSPPPESLATSVEGYAEDVKAWLEQSGGWRDSVSVKLGASSQDTDLRTWWSQAR